MSEVSGNFLWLKINGESREVADGLSLAQLIEKLSFASGRVAIELNHSVVRRVEWPTTKIKEGDQVEIVHFVGGGDGGKQSQTTTKIK